MEEKSKGLRRRKYDADFKAEVFKMVANGQSVAYVFKSLDIIENLICRWKQKRKGEKEGGKPPFLRCRLKISN